MSNRRTVLLATIALAAGCAGAPPPPAAPPPQRPAELSAQQLLEIAAALERRGDALRAGQYLSLALEQGADAARVVPRLLRLYVRDGQYRLALDLAENHLRRRPRDLRTRFFLGTLYMGLDMNARAAEQYQRLLAADGCDPQAPACAAERHEGLGRLRADAHFALASLLHEQGQDLGRADAHYRAYLHLRPTGPHAEAARAALLTELPVIPTEIFSSTLAELFAPVGAYLEDPSVSEIMINGPDQIFVERRGKLELTAARFGSPEAVMAGLRNIAQLAGTFVDDDHPILEARLPDGSRLEAVVMPVACGGPLVSIRRFSRSVLTLAGLCELGALDADTAEALRVMAIAKCNVIVAGGTGSGKTSLLNVLAGCAPEGERVLVLEDTREIEIQHGHVVYLAARKPDDRGRGGVPIRELFRAALRMRPDRIVVGEIRGAEALDMVQAMVSGHGGCLSTLHASYPRDTLTRLETMCMMSDVNMPLTAIRMQIGSGIDVIVQLERLVDGMRKVTHVCEVAGFDPERGRYELVDLFERRYHGRAEDGRVQSELVPTGKLPGFAPRLSQHGVALPASMLRAAEARAGAP